MSKLQFGTGKLISSHPVQKGKAFSSFVGFVLVFIMLLLMSSIPYVIQDAQNSPYRIIIFSITAIIQIGLIIYFFSGLTKKNKTMECGCFFV